MSSTVGGQVKPARWRGGRDDHSRGASVAPVILISLCILLGGVCWSCGAEEAGRQVNATSAISKTSHVEANLAAQSVSIPRTNSTTTTTTTTSQPPSGSSGPTTTSTTTSTTSSAGEVAAGRPLPLAGHPKSNRPSAGAVEQLDGQATAQSATFVRPAAGQQHPQQPAGGSSKTSGAGSSNKWTHFGARLRPLTGARQQVRVNEPPGQHEPAATSESSAIMGTGSQQLARWTGQQQQQPARHLNHLNGNQLDDNNNGNQLNGHDDEDDDDDDDSEALLYKMMQQPPFLMNPRFQEQEQQQQVNGNKLTVDTLNGNLAGQRQTATTTATTSTTNNNNNKNNLAASSKKVIKLLKSYSHIHQVDDSDDQIRGTYTPLSSSPSSLPRKSHSWQERKKGQEQHIFVSSQPIKAQPSQQSSRQTTGHQLNGPLGGRRPNSLANEQAPEEAATKDEPDEADEFECPNNGIFADVASGCQAYHVCQSGAQVQEKFQCPLGTLFNNIILTCDFAHNVQCSADKFAVGSPASSSWPPPPQQQPAPARPPVPRPPAIRQQQQQPQPSRQVNQQTFARAPSSGPRQLVIGNAQPRPQLALTGSRANESGDDDDDERPEPLVAAKLPVRPGPSSSTPATMHSLPYLAPPPAQVSARQSAHLSRYPGQAMLEPASLGNFGGASSMSPVFAGQEEATTGPTTDRTATTTTTTTTTTAAVANNAKATSGRPTQAFSVVINHVTGSQEQQLKQQQASLQQNRHINYKAASSPAAHSDRSSPARQTAPPSAAINQPANSNKVNLDKVSPRQQVAGPKSRQHGNWNNNNNNNENINRQPYNQRFEIQRAPVVKPAKGAQVSGNRQRVNYATEASQPAAVHQAQQTGQRVDGQLGQLTRTNNNNNKQTSGLLVDLTNDNRQASSVASDAINDGLILIVRHSPSAGPIKVGGRQEPQVAGATSAISAASTSSNKSPPANANGQAFAVDPNLISPNSAIDAHLFPNVQRALAAGSSNNRQASRHLAGSWPTSGRQSEQVAAAASSSQAVASTSVGGRQKTAAKTPARRVRRAKRLRPAQQPPSTSIGAANVTPKPPANGQTPPTSTAKKPAN